MLGSTLDSPVLVSADSGFGCCDCDSPVDWSSLMRFSVKGGEMGLKKDSRVRFAMACVLECTG